MSPHGPVFVRPEQNSPHAAGCSGMERRRVVQSKTGVSTPSTLCSFGLVVVYCSRMRFSGKT